MTLNTLIYYQRPVFHSGSVTYWVCDLGHFTLSILESVQFSSLAQLCLTLCDPINCSMPGFPTHHQLLELAQTHVS